MTASSVFSMFGGGEKKEKKEDEDRGDNSGSAKAQREAKAEEVSSAERRVRQGGDKANEHICRIGGGPRERGCPLRARRQADREGRGQDQRGV